MFAQVLREQDDIALPDCSPLRGGSAQKLCRGTRKGGQKMKKMALFVGKIASFVGLAMFFTLASLDDSAAECHRGFAKNTSGSESHDEINSSSQAACTDTKAFHIPAAVPLFLSAIAGLGVVAFRGKPR